MDRLVARRWPRLALLAVLAVAGWRVARGPDHGTAGSSLTGPAPTLRLPDDQGGRFDLASRRGEVTLVYFGYTSCPDVCPTTLGELAEVWRHLGPDRDRFRTVFVTLDPVRDTPAVLRGYLANFPPAPLGLTGPPAAIAEAARAWGITWRPSEGGRFIDHSSVVAVVGPDGRLRLRYGYSQMGDPAAIARDLERVLHDHA